MIAIGHRLKKLRELRGLSQGQIAASINSTQNYVSLLEHDKRKPSLSTLEALAQSLECSVGDFFQEELAEPSFDMQALKMESEPVLVPDLGDAPSLSIPTIEDTYRAAEDRGEKILAENTLKRLDRMATLYEVHFTLKAYFDERQPWSKIAQVISQDRVLSVKIWEAGKAKALEHGRVPEGPEPNMAPETGHVETALRFLGETGIKAIVFHATEAELQELMAEISLGCPDYDRAFWCHGAITAHAMLRLLTAYGEVSRSETELPSPGVVFRMGLLLDVGMLFMHLDDPRSTQEVWVECTRTPRYMAYPRGEWHLYQKYLHALKGAQVMRLARWSALEIQVTESHHEPGQVDEFYPHLPVIQCAHVADVIASLIVSAPSLTLDDLDLDQGAFDAVFGRRDTGFIRDLVTAVVEDARTDTFNQLWSWPGYRELLGLMVPSAARHVQGDRRTGEGYPRPFSWWLNQNEMRAGEILVRYHQDREERRSN
jgi:transcriptional regulator with XRE-family HTH domain